MSASRELLAHLVAFNTTSRESNLALIEFVRDYLAEHGVSSELIYNEDGSKANLFASIGPACSEAAGELGLRIDLEANPHKMGILVRTAAEHAPGLRERFLERQAG